MLALWVQLAKITLDSRNDLSISSIASYENLVASVLLRNERRVIQAQQVPITQPNASRQDSYLVRREPHGRANERVLLGTEIQDRQRRQERSRQLQQTGQQETQALEQLMDEEITSTAIARPFHDGEDT